MIDLIRFLGLTSSAQCSKTDSWHRRRRLFRKQLPLNAVGPITGEIGNIDQSATRVEFPSHENRVKAEESIVSNCVTETPCSVAESYSQFRGGGVVCRRNQLSVGRCREGQSHGCGVSYTPGRLKKNGSVASTGHQSRLVPPKVAESTDTPD